MVVNTSRSGEFLPCPVRGTVLDQNGFILIVATFILLLLAVSALVLNQKAGLHARMAANQSRNTQVFASQAAAVEEAVWQLTKDPCWRTSSEGESYPYNEVTYNRWVLNSTIMGYEDALTVSVMIPGGLKPMKSSFRYCIFPPFESSDLDTTPYQVCLDASNNIYFADPKTHTVYMRNAMSGAIASVAGNGSSGFSGDGGPATGAKLDKPRGVSVDSSGDIFIADTDNHRIRKVDKLTGNISTVAGSGFSGFSGDGGPATSARLDKPRGVFVDSSGNIFIADTDNNRIREVNIGTGNIHTISGIGAPGYEGDGGLAIDAKLNHPKGIWVDSMGEVTISDSANGCLRNVNIAGVISSLFSSGGLGLSNAQGIALGLNGDLYIADTDNHLIRKLDSTGEITVLAGTGAAGFSGDNGPALSAKLDKPRGIAIDLSGNIYIADTDNDCIRKVNTSGIIATVAGIGGSEGDSGDFGPATSARLDSPEDIAVDASGNLYIADTGNNRIRMVDTSGRIRPFAGTGIAGYSFGLALYAKLNKPKGVFVDSLNNVYIADTENNCVRFVNASNGLISRIAGDTNSGYSGDGGIATNARLNKPRGVFKDSAGNIFIVDTDNHVIRLVNGHDGIITTLAGTGAAGFNGDDQPSILAKLNKPSGVVMAATRGGAKIYISDTGNDRIRTLRFRIVREIY